MKLNNLSKIILPVIFCELVGIISGVFTINAIPTWYKTLNKPFFSPPNWIFGPVWTILYVLMGIAFGIIWIKYQKNKKAKKGIIYFIIQLVLNFFWSFLFFGLRNPLLAFGEIIALWIMIVLTTFAFYKISKPASYLMIPYLLWVSFAMILDFTIVILN